MHPLRLLTYNVHDLRDDPDAVAHVIRSCDPDVVCLQEVPRRMSAPWRVGRLSRETGLRWSAGGRGSGGTAVFTSRRVDIVHTSVGRLPVGGVLRRTRGYALAQVRVAQVPPVAIVSVHLPLLPAQRQAHAQTVLRRLGALPAPWLVAGDLNELPGGPAWAAFAPQLQDAASVAPGHGEPTYPAKAGEPTYPAKAPSVRIDAVLVSSEVIVERLVVAGPAEHLSLADLRVASDHLPLIADLRLPT